MNQQQLKPSRRSFLGAAAIGLGAVADLALMGSTQTRSGREGGYILQGRLAVSQPGRAPASCPYSKATQGHIDITRSPA